MQFFAYYLYLNKAVKILMAWRNSKTNIILVSFHIFDQQALIDGCP